NNLKQRQDAGGISSRIGKRHIGFSNNGFSLQDFLIHGIGIKYRQYLPCFDAIALLDQYTLDSNAVYFGTDISDIFSVDGAIGTECVTNSVLAWRHRFDRQLRLRAASTVWVCASVLHTVSSWRLIAHRFITAPVLADQYP